MTVNFVMDLARQSLVTTLLVVAPVMVVGFVVGIIVSLVQAVMQLQEMTITFVPKIIAIGLTLLVTGAWMIKQLMTYSVNLLGHFPEILGRGM
ncbi:MAG: flagellar type III secretion system protein FliQ [Deltaproteobacteria bacterium]|nr:MAG: flagellar type III secretion system protein FliQ [Deltaproteobacteria bacterium]